MFEVNCTGKNEHYGKKGEKRLLSDHLTFAALKNGWITDRFKWVGHQKTAQPLIYKEVAMPYKVINVERTLEAQSKKLERIQKELINLQTILNGLKSLMKENKNEKKI